ncbi:MAG: glycosyltransferase family 2 protein [Trichlorobacter sp.]|uniref:glycosyltransferase family 2 protein n=1 Tax=Trichlorobacter sp. TaxID=2911007 RepID=UPI0025668A4D|nr:glycosyltransferase family 2 protein [Trichlorobacter sp.]MDK9718799.1 glycosyltransferase family 2 protein [Trichlorobacter sp.]
MATCILIPAYNAAATLRAVLVDCLVFDMPLVVVDDGSTDGTAQTLDGLPVTLLTHSVNRGKGAALKTGFDWAIQHQFDGVVTLDADGQHDPSAIPRLLAEVDKKGYDCLLASRHSQFEEMAGLRKVWNRFGVWCIRKRTGFEITDSQSGFRFYHARLLRAVRLEKNGYDLEMELLVKGWKAGFTIGSLPVPARVADGRATSHYRPVQDTWNICMTFLRYM